MFVKCKTCMLDVSRKLKIADTPQPSSWTWAESRRVYTEGLIYFSNEAPMWGAWSAGKGCMIINPDDSINVDFDRKSRGCCAYGNCVLSCRNGHKVGFICIDCYEYYVAFDGDLVVTTERVQTVMR